MELTREIIEYTTHEAWLSDRAVDLTSTEAAALFGASPYLTEFELYHRKVGTLPIDEFKTNPRMVWGNRLEAAIAAGIAEDMGLIVIPFKVYMRIPQLRMGSSFDFKIIGITPDYAGEDESARDMFRQHGTGIMEVKNVDGLQFRRTWADEGFGIEAPAHIEMQVQHQLEVADLSWTLIAPLVGGNTPVPLIRVRDRAVGDALKLAAAEFWSHVEHLCPPEPAYTKDADAIGALYLENDGSSIDLSGDPRVYALCKSYKLAGTDEKAAVEKKRAAKAELLTIIKSAKTITTTGFKMSAGTLKEVYKSYDREAGERVTISISQIKAAHIESTTPARRDLRISEVK